MNKNISRRNFIKIGAAGLGAILLAKNQSVFAYLPEFPKNDRLGRVFSKAEIKVRPDPDSATVNTLFDDSIVLILREVIGARDLSGFKTRLWYETPEGYISSLAVQPVKTEINVPLNDLPTYGAVPGFWAEVTVPFVDIYLDGDSPKSPRLLEIAKPRFYYSQVLWVDGIKKNEINEINYHVIEKHGSYGDKFWADSRAFKPLIPDDLSAINPQITDKKIIVDVSHQTLSCLEDNREIFYTTVSTGAKFDMYGNKVDNWSTPVGDYHAINRKYVSLHMAGGTSKASGYEEFAVAYTSIFATGGVAFHSTYWHNAWGDPMSHGCVNLRPDDSKFIYRWSQPNTPYESGFFEQAGYDGTKVQVVEY
ncbi:MAG: L,D-transpeptidase family protein [Chloroflexi bacterium]|nr:L,D-transpeptidase family protein [Chloroflexota bacterium]